MTLRLTLALLVALLSLPVLAATVVVTVGPGLVFVPSTQNITAGDTIQWQFAQGGHSTTSNATSGPDAWDSTVLAMGQTFSHTFNNVGSFPYYCSVHSSANGSTMNGVINVAAPAPVAPAMSTILLITLATVLSAVGVLMMRR